MLQELGNDQYSGLTAIFYNQSQISKKYRLEQNHMKTSSINLAEFDISSLEGIRSMHVVNGNQNSAPQSSYHVLDLKVPEKSSYENQQKSSQDEQQDKMKASIHISQLEINQSQIIQPMESSLISNEGDNENAHAASYGNVNQYSPAMDINVRQSTMNQSQTESQLRSIPDTFIQMQNQQMIGPISQNVPNSQIPHNIQSAQGYIQPIPHDLVSNQSTQHLGQSMTRIQLQNSANYRYDMITSIQNIGQPPFSNQTLQNQQIIPIQPNETFIEKPFIQVLPDSPIAQQGQTDRNAAMQPQITQNQQNPAQQAVENFGKTEIERSANPIALPEAEDRSQSITDVLSDPNTQRQNGSITPVSSIETYQDTQDQPQINKAPYNEHQKYEEHQMHYSNKQTELTQAQYQPQQIQSDYDQPKSFPQDYSIGDYSGQVSSIPNAQEKKAGIQQGIDIVNRSSHLQQSSLTFGMDLSIIQQEPNFQMQISEDALQNGSSLLWGSNQTTNSMTPNLNQQIYYGQNQFTVQSPNYSNQQVGNYNHQVIQGQNQQYNSEEIFIELYDDSSQDNSQDEEIIVIYEDGESKQGEDEVPQIYIDKGIPNTPDDRQIQTQKNHDLPLQISGVKQSQVQGSIQQLNRVPSNQQEAQAFNFPPGFIQQEDSSILGTLVSSKIQSVDISEIQQKKEKGKEQQLQSFLSSDDSYSQSKSIPLLLQQNQVESPKQQTYTSVGESPANQNAQQSLAQIEEKKQTVINQEAAYINKSLVENPQQRIEEGKDLFIVQDQGRQNEQTQSPTSLFSNQSSHSTGEQQNASYNADQNIISQQENTPAQSQYPPINFEQKQDIPQQYSPDQHYYTPNPQQVFQGQAVQDQQSYNQSQLENPQGCIPSQQPIASMDEQHEQVHIQQRIQEKIRKWQEQGIKRPPKLNIFGILQFQESKIKQYNGLPINIRESYNQFCQNAYKRLQDSFITSIHTKQVFQVNIGPNIPQIQQIRNNLSIARQLSQQNVIESLFQLIQRSKTKKIQNQPAPRINYLLPYKLNIQNGTYFLTFMNVGNEDLQNIDIYTSSKKHILSIPLLKQVQFGDFKINLGNEDPYILFQPLYAVMGPYLGQLEYIYQYKIETRTISGNFSIVLLNSFPTLSQGPVDVYIKIHQQYIQIGTANNTAQKVCKVQINQNILELIPDIQYEIVAAYQSSRNYASPIQKEIKFNDKQLLMMRMEYFKDIYGLTQAQINMYKVLISYFGSKQSIPLRQETRNYILQAIANQTPNLFRECMNMFESQQFSQTIFL